MTAESPPGPAQEVPKSAQPSQPVHHHSPARSPREGGARSAAAARASSSRGAAPGPGGASRPAAPALGANCQGSKARVRREPRWHHRGRVPAHVEVRVGRVRRASWGTLVNQGCPFTPACLFADSSCTHAEAGIPELTLHPGAHPQNPACVPWPACTPPETAKHTYRSPRISPRFYSHAQLNPTVSTLQTRRAPLT